MLASENAFDMKDTGWLGSDGLPGYLSSGLPEDSYVADRVRDL